MPKVMAWVMVISSGQREREAGAAMKVGLWGVVLQCPVGFVAAFLFEDHAQGDIPAFGIWQHLAVDLSHEPKTIREFLAGNQGAALLLRLRYCLPIIREGVAGPVAVGSKIELQVAGLSGRCDERFTAGSLP